MNTKKNIWRAFGAAFLIFVLSTSAVLAQAPPQNQQATPNIGIPPELMQLFMQIPQEAPDGPTPEMMEGLYHNIWATIAQTYHDVDALNKADWGRWKNAYDGKIQTLAQLDSALEAMVGALGDRYTRYTSPTSMRVAAQKKADGIVSIGIDLVAGTTGGAYTVAFISAGSPALNSVRWGDQIVEVQGKPLEGLTKAEVNALLEGKVGTSFVLKRKVAETTETVELTFAAIPEPQTEVRMLPGGILYMRLTGFDEEQVGLLERGIAAVTKAGTEPFAGMIFDLRGNGGGEGAIAFHVGELLMKSGVFMTSNSRTGRRVETTTSTIAAFKPFDSPKDMTQAVCQTDLLHDKPLVVLINGSSASASELLVAALKDNERADILGTRTFGKDIGFTGKRLPNGGVLQVTMANARSPKGYRWFGVGIEPTTVLEQPRNTTVDVQLLAGVELLNRRIAARASK